MVRVAARDRYFETLLDRAKAERHPSPGLVDRLVQSMRSRQHAEQVIDVLLDTAGRYPSPWMLDRVNSLVGLLELADQLQELHERHERPEAATSASS